MECHAGDKWQGAMSPMTAWLKKTQDDANKKTRNIGSQDRVGGMTKSLTDSVNDTITISLDDILNAIRVAFEVAKSRNL